jgi:hypothetical protein
MHVSRVPLIDFISYHLSTKLLERACSNESEHDCGSCGLLVVGLQERLAVVIVHSLPVPIRYQQRATPHPVIQYL